jgi:hypothetical protein
MGRVHRGLAGLGRPSWAKPGGRGIRRRGPPRAPRARGGTRSRAPGRPRVSAAPVPHQGPQAPSGHDHPPETRRTRTGRGGVLRQPLGAPGCEGRAGALVHSTGAATHFRPPRFRIGGPVTPAPWVGVGVTGGVTAPLPRCRCPRRWCPRRWCRAGRGWCGPHGARCPLCCGPDRGGPGPTRRRSRSSHRRCPGPGRR